MSSQCGLDDEATKEGSSSLEVLQKFSKEGNEGFESKRVFWFVMLAARILFGRK